MRARRDKFILSTFAVVVLGILLPLTVLGWYLWRESLAAEEARLGELSQRLGEQVEAAIVDARSLLEELNELKLEPCSDLHLERLQEKAIARPHVRAIGYWRAAERQCGAGFVQGAALTPPRASRIYESGVIAWWPGPETAIGAVELFLMRFGQHDVAIDPRLLLNPGVLEDQAVGLWVEGLPMVAYPPGAELPDPSTVADGLTLDRPGERIISRFSLGAIFPIDVVAVQPLKDFWDRYLPTLLIASVAGLILAFILLLLMLRYLRRHFSMTRALREAIAEDRLDVSYQPIVDLASGRWTGAEALARWRPEVGESISPEVFVPLAEESGQATDLTLSVLRTVLREMGDLLRAHPELEISINITEQDLSSPRFSNLLADLLRHEGLQPSSIELEITERALVRGDEIRDCIARLRERGHRIAIDDFGTGYSSLAYLETFRVDTLKIDKAFTDAIEREAVGSSMIGHIIGMARSLDLDVVAEGLESAHQVEWLRGQGVGFGQGFHFGRPLSARKFQARFSEST